MELLVWKIDCDSIGIDNFCVDQNVSLLSIQICPFKFSDVGSPHCEEHEPLVRIEGDSSRLGESDGKNRFADQIGSVFFLAAKQDDLAGVVEEVPVHGGPVDRDLIGRVQREHVRLRKSPPMYQIVDVGAKQIGFGFDRSSLDFG